MTTRGVLFRRDHVLVRLFALASLGLAPALLRFARRRRAGALYLERKSLSFLSISFTTASSGSTPSSTWDSISSKISLSADPFGAGVAAGSDGFAITR